MSLYGRGLNQSTPAKVAHRLGADLHPAIGAALKAGIRGAGDLSRFRPLRRFKQRGSTCFAHSVSSALVIAHAAVGRPLPFLPSPLLIASTTYAGVRAAAFPSGLVPRLKDTGAELQDVATAMARWGVGPMGPAADDPFTDVPQDDGYGFPEVNASSLVIAGANLVGGEYAVTIDDSAPEMIAASIDAGIPVWIGGPVGRAYELLGPNDIAQPTPADDATAGGHAQVVDGYRVTSSGEIETQILGSWGPEWALNGSVWASEAWIRSQWLAWPMAVAGRA